MGIGSNPQPGTTVRWSSTLFLTGGCLMVGHAGMQGLQAFADLPTLPDPFGPPGHFVALLGLVGLYPVVVDRRPVIARAAGAVAVVALLGWGAMTGTRLLAAIGAVDGGLLPNSVVGVMFVSTIVTYVLFGVAARSVADWPSNLGLLVLAPAVLLAGAMVASVVIDLTAREGFVVSVGLALAMGSLGYTLRTAASGTDRAGRPVGVTGG